MNKIALIRNFWKRKKNDSIKFCFYEHFFFLYTERYLNT